MAPKHPKFDQILDLAKQGRRGHEIADALDIPRPKVSNIMWRMRQKGYLPQHQSNPYSVMRYKFERARKGKRFGQLKEMVSDLPPEVGLWLYDQLPPDAKLTDLIRAIIIDAHEDSK